MLLDGSLVMLSLDDALDGEIYGSSLMSQSSYAFRSKAIILSTEEADVKTARTK